MMDDVRDDYISRKQLYDYVKYLMNTHDKTVNVYIKYKVLLRVLEYISVVPGKEKYNDTFAFDFSNVKRFNCQCGRHYVNTGACCVAGNEREEDDKEQEKFLKEHGKR